ncbi:MAG TPA: copper resistance protein CopC [Actinomycetota bacterium]|nr:copper resistance protein CopC [Actinomycetota bacterium]
MKRIPPALAAMLVAGIWLSLAATTAFAHASLESSDPSNGELLETAPDRISLTFTEPPDLSLTTIGVLDDTGAPVPTGPPELAPGSDREVRVRLDPVPDGVYTVTWRTVSATDGHVTSNAFSFGVGVSPEAVRPLTGGVDETEPPSAAAVAGHWLLYLGLVVLFGAGVTGLVAFGTSSIRSWLLGIGWVSAATGVVLMTLAERAAVGVPLGTLLSSEAGGKFVLLAVAVGVTGIAVLAAVLRPGRATLAALAVTAAGAMLARATGGHAGSVWMVLAQWLHFMGVGAWIGGLAWLSLGLLRRLEPAQVRRFSTLAGVALAVVVVSGLLRSWNELGLAWWLHPFRDDYSTTLALKVAIVIPLIGLGALNRYRNVPRYGSVGSQPMLRTVGGELALAAAVLLATGVLTGLPPKPNEEPAGPRARPLVVTGADFATTTRVRLEISPGTVGPNTFVADVTDYDSGEPVDARRVSLTFDLPDQPDVRSTLRLERRDGSWRGQGTALAQPGTWTVTVLVEGSGSSVEVPLQVTPTTPGQHVDVSKVPGQPTLYTITLEGGLQIQAYVDPGEPGRTNQVHVTAFDADGKELPLHAATLSITPPEGASFEPKLLRFGPGHFAANIDLTAGTWSFDVAAHAATGQVLAASFRQSFEG